MNPAYRFVKYPAKWDDSCHKWPCSETRHLDSMLNDMKACEITLTPKEFSLCRQYAIRQNNESRNNRNKKVSKRSDEQIQFEGYVGQCAVCHYFGFHFLYTGGSYRKADLPCRIEVKTRTENWHDCKVRPDDDNDLRCVHVVFRGQDRPVRIGGWITALDGKMYRLIDPEDADEPFHAVPTKVLRPMLELKAIVDKERNES